MNDQQPASVELTDETIILDNRTPEEWAEGHLEGARLVDFNGGEVEQVLPTLDPSADYLVYCRSGGRSGRAMALMQEAGIQRVRNLGGLGQAATATGLPIVTD